MQSMKEMTSCQQWPWCGCKIPIRNFEKPLGFSLPLNHQRILLNKCPFWTFLFQDFVILNSLTFPWCEHSLKLSKVAHARGWSVKSNEWQRSLFSLIISAERLTCSRRRQQSSVILSFSVAVSQTPARTHWQCHACVRVLIRIYWL